MEPITIECTSCHTPFRLSSELLGRVHGRTGRVSCRSCGARVRIDGRLDAFVFYGAQAVDQPEGSGRRSSLPPPLPEAALLKHSSRPAPGHPAREGTVGRATQSTLSPHTLEDDGDVRIPKGSESSPFAGDDCTDDVYEQVRAPRSSRKPVLPAEPRVASVKPVSIAPPPPRPWELRQMPHDDEAPGSPFDGMFGLSVPPPLPEVVHLSADGRLLNLSDSERARPRRRWGVGIAALAAMLLGVGLSFAAVQSDYAWLSPARASAQADLGKLAELALASPADSTVEDEQVAAPELTLLLEAPISDSALAEDAHPVADAAQPSEEVAVPRTGTAKSSAAPQGEAAPSTDESASEEEPTEEVDADAPLPGFDTGSAKLALEQATGHASACRSDTDPSGVARVVLTFAPSGRVTNATISGPPFAGTKTGGCIANHFRGASVPAFSGDYVTVSKTVVVN